MNTEDRVKQIMAESSGAHIDKIGPLSRFDEDLGMDSLDRIEACMAVEEAFSIEIPDEEAEQLKDVRHLIEYVEKKKKP